MEKICRNCTYWTPPKGEWEWSDIRLDRDANLNPINAHIPHANECKSPKAVFYSRPDKDGCALVDGSEYKAALLTGPEFGCVNFVKREV